MTDKQFQKLYEKLRKASQEYQDMNAGNEEDCWLYQMYSLDTKKGKCFYEQITDEQLLDILKEASVEQNHSPAQKEIFWVWRQYIKKRFHKWPYALKAAGLSKAAGVNGKTREQMEADQEEYQMLLSEVRKKAEELCRIPHPQEIPELCKRLRKFIGDWNEVIRNASLDSGFFREKSVYKITDLEPEYQEELKKLFYLAQTLGRAPMKDEMKDDMMKKELISRCGSWRNVLYQIGLEPVMKKNPFSATYMYDALEGKQKKKKHKTKLQDCYYRVLNPSGQTWADLKELYELKKKLNRIPDKKEVSPELKKRLQQSCGSWTNAIYQLKYLDKDGRK